MRRQNSALNGCKHYPSSIYIKIFMQVGTHIQTILRSLLQKFERLYYLLLLRGDILKLGRSDGLRSQDTFTKFHRDSIVVTGIHIQTQRQQGHIVNILHFCEIRKEDTKLDILDVNFILISKL
jgi:hypothetical protein